MKVNRDFIGKSDAKWGYLMRRGEDCMYDGVIKYNLQTDEIDTVVDFGNKRLGGETLFINKAGATEDEDSYISSLTMNLIPDSDSVWRRTTATSSTSSSMEAIQREVPTASVPRSFAFGMPRTLHLNRSPRWRCHTGFLSVSTRDGSTRRSSKHRLTGFNLHVS